MSWKSFACVAALSAMATPALAAPSISIVDNLDGTGSVEVTIDAAGSLGAEIALAFTDATLVDATINSAIFDEANPGDSPFIPGTLVGGDASGLNVDAGAGEVFAAFGGADPGLGTFTFLDFTYTGSGTAQATGYVAQGGDLGDFLDTGAVDIGDDIGPEPLAGDFDGNGSVGDGDLTLLLSNWAASVPPVPAGWDGAQPTAPGIGDDELTALLSTWGQSQSSLAIPEPTAAVIALMGLACLSARRSA